MKFILLFMVCIISNTIVAQQVLTNAKIVAKIETQQNTDEMSNGGMTFRFGGGGDNIIKIFIKDSMSKVYSETEVAIAHTISNSASGKRIILNESNGEKTGFETTAADRADQKRRADSTTKAMEENPAPQGGGMMFRSIRANINTDIKNIEYIEETKTINDIKCKKAIVTIKKGEEEEKMELWYSANYILPEGIHVDGQGRMSFPNLKGLPIQYTMVSKMKIMDNEIVISRTYTVTSIDTVTAIDDKEFKVPKGYKIKTYAEWVKDNPEGFAKPKIMQMRM